MKLNERAMLVSLHLSAWMGERIDHKVTREVLHERKADPKAGKFTKYLISKTALEPILRAHSATRRDFYRLALPWSDDSVRIISSEQFFDFRDVMVKQHKRKCEGLYEDFVQKYPDCLAEAPRFLGGTGLFNPRDYPGVNEIRHKFSFKLGIMPIPDKEDFRVGLDSELVDQIREDIEQTVSERSQNAQRELWMRMFKAVKQVAVTLRDPKRKVFSSVIEGLQDLAHKAPKLSLVPDPMLEEVCQEVLEILNGVHVDTLRKNRYVRSRAANKAQEAAAKIESTLDSTKALAKIEDSLAGVF